MKMTTLALFTLLVPLAGCDPAASSVGELDSALRNCPPEGCPGPGDPGDPPPKKPPPPPQPDPAKYRTAYLSIAYLQQALNADLDGTRIQITHTTGQALTFPSFMQSCTHVGNTAAEQQECEDACNSADGLTPAQKATCRANCAGHDVCSTFCGSHTAMNYVRWGFNLIAASLQSSSKYCTSTTCPACNPAVKVPSLANLELNIPEYSNSFGIWPAEVDVTCRLNQIALQVAGNITVDSTPDALYVTMPGTTGSPAVICDNAPDANVDNFGVQLRFTFPWAQAAVATEASTVGDWHILAPGVAYLTDLSGRISDGVKSGTHNMLNSPDNQKALFNAFAGIVEQYVDTQTSEKFAKMGYIESQYGQLKVTYYVQ